MTIVTEDYDLLVVGMGPVGATAANLAGQAGLRVLVVEQETVPYQKPRAIAFDAEVMRIFASIGLAGEIAAVTRALDGSVHLGADHRPVRTFAAPPRAHRLASNSSNLFYQPELEEILRAGLRRFSNVTVALGSGLRDLSLSEGGVTAGLVSVSGEPNEVSARYLLACDGASSTVRKNLGIALDDIGFEERWLVVDTTIAGPMRWPEAYDLPDGVRKGDYSLMVCDPARPCTLIPGRGTHRRFEYMLLPGESDDVVVSERWLREQVGKWVDPADVTFIRAAVYRFRALVAECWQVGPVTLMGDAAHQTPPFFGQGMCHGIRDAAQFLWKLDLVHAGIASATLLESYQVEREPHVRAIISASVAAGEEVCKLDPVAAAARDRALRAAEAARGQDIIMADIIPPITQGIVANGGMRLPEFVIASQQGEVHIDTLLAGRFTLLAFDHRPETPQWDDIGGQVMIVSPQHADAESLIDADGRLEAWIVALEARWAIVRPDRYVFATGNTDEELATALADLDLKLCLVPPSDPDQPITSLEITS